MFRAPSRSHQVEKSEFSATRLGESGASSYANAATCSTRLNAVVIRNIEIASVRMRGDGAGAPISKRAKFELYAYFTIPRKEGGKSSFVPPRI
jgi:hypothetical protein